jgi:hypothetical protein
LIVDSHRFLPTKDRRSLLTTPPARDVVKERI